MRSRAPSPADTLGEEDLREISKHAVTRRFPAKAIVVTEGDRSDSLYIIVEGRAKAYVSDDSGREVILSVMGPGEFFGELALDEGPRSASVITLEPTVLSIVPRADFDEFVQGHPRFANHLIHHLIGRIRALTKNVTSLALMDVYGRVARLLIESSAAVDGVQVVEERITQAEIAKRVGCSREMVSRIFKDLVQGGYITLLPDRIVIHRTPPARW
jgi:CRP/FNR family transcriptional regulator, cyclic AMP receptor protein